MEVERKRGGEGGGRGRGGEAGGEGGQQSHPRLEPATPGGKGVFLNLFDSICDLMRIILCKICERFREIMPVIICIALEPEINLMRVKLIRCRKKLQEVSLILKVKTSHGQQLPRPQPFPCTHSRPRPCQASCQTSPGPGLSGNDFTP